MQAYFYPYIGYFQLILAVDRFVLYPHVDYIQRGWMHRNRVLIKWGRVLYIKVLLQPGSTGGKARDVRVATDLSWRRRLLRTIHHNYAGSAFFEETFPIVEGGILAQFEFLHDYNANSLRILVDHLGIPTPIALDCAGSAEVEARLAAEPDLIDGVQRKTRRVFALCRNEGADTYVNPIGGLGLYDPAAFERNGLNLEFVRPRAAPYRQFSTEFVPYLSIIDVLMHLGREGTRARLFAAPAS
jgi:hypothetical protein